MIIIEKEYKTELCKTILRQANFDYSNNRFLEVFIEEYWRLPENVLMFHLGHALNTWKRIHNYNGVINGNYDGYVIDKHKLTTPMQNIEKILESMCSYESSESSYEDILDYVVK